MRGPICQWRSAQLRYNGQHNPCRAGKCTSPWTHTEDATATSVCSRETRQVFCDCQNHEHSSAIWTTCVCLIFQTVVPSQETKVENAAHSKVEEYPDMEQIHSYDPLEFEKYSIPEDVVLLSRFALPGLASFPPSPHLCEEDQDKFDPLPQPSPVKMPKRSDYYSELEAFLQTIDELTVELPPDPVTD
ncbi:hypothetical protein JOB18_038995 [Solea senegalensis]|uniref:Securin n=1 Tax=Solea senegalensis TaxID=28829 RepID=A0AAV6SLP6_SOLSE|nr:hypothetical protein JOB18_038995 [Solea senegalensis]